MPRVSVIMSVFNGEPFLRAALESMFRQTFTDFEFIIIDDGSTDRSAAIIREYIDPRLILLEQDNQGIAMALNRGLSIAQGEYIARQDADDISHPERFRVQLEFLDAHPEIAVLGTAGLLIDSEGRQFSAFLPFTRHEQLVKELLRGVCPLLHGSVLVRRAALVDVGGYKSVFGHAQDVELWLRMSARYRLANVRDVLYQLRKHDESITQKAHIDLMIKTFARKGGFSTNTSAEAWVRFVEEFNCNFHGSWREHAFEAENRLRKAQVNFTQGKRWQALWNIAGAMWLNPRLVTDLPNRIFHRLCRTSFQYWTNATAGKGSR
jgi:glycosyltransferase involved in cell wall biosynthesis